MAAYLKGFKPRNKGRVRFTGIDGASAIANITTTASSGSLPAADGSVTIADATTPTVAKLLEYCVELETKVEAILTALRDIGAIPSS